MSFFSLEPSWREVLQEELGKPYFLDLAAFVEEERFSGKTVYPSKDLVFNAFWKTPYKKTRVVIVGQDPYHGPGQAHGLSFSVPKGISPPPSLRNIFKEISSDVGGKMPEHGCLLSWANQGVLLLNASLTVLQGKPMSHQGVGWERFTDAVITAVCGRKDPIIFVLWGKFARQKCQHIIKKFPEHHVLSASHPSPLSAHAGFLGCKHFSKINQLLEKVGSCPIRWDELS